MKKNLSFYSFLVLILFLISMLVSYNIWAYLNYKELIESRVIENSINLDREYIDTITKDTIEDINKSLEQSLDILNKPLDSETRANLENLISKSIEDRLIKLVKESKIDSIIETTTPKIWLSKPTNNTTKVTSSDYDFYLDDSILKYIWPDVSFNRLDYVPIDLVNISSDYVLDTKWWQTLRLTAKRALDNLSRDFYNEFWVKISIVSAYRSYEYQKWIKDNWCSDLFCAKPWHSEHQSWLTFDIFEASDVDSFLWNPDYARYYGWLTQNAHKYGFTQSYRYGRNTDGYTVEPWHWRYVGINLATILKNEDITFTQFYNKMK